MDSTAMKSKTVKYLLATGVMLAAASWTTVASARAACPKWMCGSNSPVVEGAAIEGRAFHELSEAGAARHGRQSGRSLTQTVRIQLIPGGTP
jgi:transcription elongation factor